MISQVSITTLLIVVFSLTALFLVLKKFNLPSSFYENQKKREEQMKSKINRETFAKEESPPGEKDESPENDAIEEG